MDGLWKHIVNQFLMKHGIDLEFVQDNQSFSATKGTLRGLHYQLNPKAQTKLVRCTQRIDL